MAGPAWCSGRSHCLRINEEQEQISTPREWRSYARQENQPQEVKTMGSHGDNRLHVSSSRAVHKECGYHSKNSGFGRGFAEGARFRNAYVDLLHQPSRTQPEYRTPGRVGKSEGVAFEAHRTRKGTAEAKGRRLNALTKRAQTRRAAVIGAGPNGLSAAIVLAQAGLQVDVFEAEPQPGGAARTLPLTLPGFLHDFGSAVHPMAAGSPFFSSLPLRDHGLEWIHSPAPLAHPLDDGSAVMLERQLSDAESALGEDGKQWRRLFGPFAEQWTTLAPEILRPVHLFTRHPLLLGRLGVVAFPSATSLAEHWFHNRRTKALFAGLAAHSVLALDEPLSAGVGLVLGTAAHAVGWPIPRGGAQSITNALCAYLANHGGTVKTSTRIESLAELEGYDVTLCDVTPRQLLAMAGDRFSPAYRRQLEKYRYGPGVFKVDYALSSPI